MLQSKKGNMIISLILAIALWMYVVGEMNPTTRKVYRDIPITLTNEQTLADNGLAVVSSSDETMSVTISGKRSNINKVKSTDIIATVDLSQATAGSNRLKINLKVPDSVEIKDQSLSVVTVKVDKRISEKKKIKVKYTGDFTNNEEPTTIKTSPEEVKVSGAGSLVKKVAYVKASISADNVTTSESASNSSLVAVDSSGNEVKNISLSTSSVAVTSVLYYKKTVSLKVPVTDTSNDNAARTTSAPDQITIKGTQSALADVDSITAKTIDISKILKTTSVDITPVLPDGIQVSDKSKNLVLKVTVKDGESSKDYTLSGSSVSLKNVGNGLKGTVNADSITVTITGTSSELSDITKSDIDLTADCSGLEGGTHSVKLVVSCDKSYSKISVSPSSVSVKIE